MKRAVTLIQLLAVLVVIAFLAILLFPVIAGAQAGRPKSTCLSNLKQLGTAFALYLDDNDHQYPTRDNDMVKITGAPPAPETRGADGLPRRDWTITLQPYIKNFQIFRCPTDTSRAPRDAKNPDWTLEYRSSYTVNGWSEYELKQSAIRRPSDWVLIAERNNVARPAETSCMFYWWTWQGTEPRVWPPSATPDPLPSASQDLALERHGERATWLFGDTSASSVLFEKLWQPGKANAFWPQAE